MAGKLTDRRKAKVVAAIEAGSVVGFAARIAGVSRRTVFREIKKDPAFKAEVERAYQTQIGRVELSLFRQAIGGNLGAICFYLKNRAPHRWKDRVEVGQEGGVTIKIVREGDDVQHEKGKDAEAPSEPRPLTEAEAREILGETETPTPKAMN